MKMVVAKYHITKTYVRKQFFECKVCGGRRTGFLMRPLNLKATFDPFPNRQTDTHRDTHRDTHTHTQ